MPGIRLVDRSVIHLKASFDHLERVTRESDNALDELLGPVGWPHVGNQFAAPRKFGRFGSVLTNREAITGQERRSHRIADVPKSADRGRVDANEPKVGETDCE